jgi:hypothetical protein
MTRSAPHQRDETPFLTRALYGSATLLALLVGARATTEAVARLADRGATLWTTLMPDVAMAGVVGLLVGVGWLIHRVSARPRAAAPA